LNHGKHGKREARQSGPGRSDRPRVPCFRCCPWFSWTRP